MRLEGEVDDPEGSLLPLLGRDSEVLPAFFMGTDSPGQVVGLITGGRLQVPVLPEISQDLSRQFLGGEPATPIRTVAFATEDLQMQSGRSRAGLDREDSLLDISARKPFQVAADGSIVNLELVQRFETGHFFVPLIG